MTSGVVCNLFYHLTSSVAFILQVINVNQCFLVLFYAAEKAKYAARDPIVALKKYLVENKLASEQELKAIEKKIDEVVEEAVEFADESSHPSRSQLLENVFADPKGFGIGPDGRYRCEDPKFTEGTAHV